MTAPVVPKVAETSGKVCHDISIDTDGYSHGCTAPVNMFRCGDKIASQSTCHCSAY